MKLSEFLQMPKTLTMPQYEKLLQERRKLEKQIRKLSLSIYEEEDALDILKDETGSERYKKHLEQMQTYKTKREKAIKRLEEINNTIKQ